MDGSAERRIAHNEVTFRRVNEALEPDAGTASYVCECGRLGCTETVRVARAEYEAIRTDFARFFVIPGHEEPDVERVVERHRHYLVVEKLGVAAGIAEDDVSDEPPAGGTPA